MATRRGEPIEISLLSVAGCPNAALMEERLAEALACCPGPAIRQRVVGDRAAAGELGMAGSPTLLVDGRDPFAGPDGEPGLACRLYPQEDGRLEGAPSVAQLRLALAAADRVGRTPGGLRGALRREILRAFAARGRAPRRSELAPVGARLGLDLGRALAALAAADLIGLDRGGRIAWAYPFSAAPTRHRVRIAGGAEVFAMCAIDALGIGPMLGADTLVRSRDPGDGRPIAVRRRAGLSLWEPAEAVVLVARARGPGGAAASCCAPTNFFAGAARAWVAEHPELACAILDRDEAERLGRAIFAPLLGAGERAA